MSGCPSHLVFDEDPSPEQLAVLLGPDAPAVRAVIREDDERVTVTQQRVPVVGVAIFLVCFAALLTSAPFWLARFGYELPAHVDPALMWTMAGALWLLIVPSMITPIHSWPGIFSCSTYSATVAPGVNGSEVSSLPSL